MSTYKKIITLFVFLGLLLFATPIFAAEIRLDTNGSETRVGEQFSIDLIMHSEESLNALEGRLEFSADKLSVVEIRDGNSVLNFWVEKPHIKSPGVIVFSGITPGGFSGANKNIFSIVFEAKYTGMTNVVLGGIKAIKNDGNGTQIILSTRDAAIYVKPGDSSAHKETLIDTESPEDFTPSLESNQNIFDKKYFVVFATQDKRSGIDHYEVREGEWGWFRTAESPYLLKNQSLDKRVFVKAIDKKGNERIAILQSQHPLPWYRSDVFFGILLLLVVAGFITRRSWPKFI